MRPTPLSEAKAAQRQHMLALRAALALPRDAPGQRLAEVLPQAGTLAGYWPLEGEADPRPAMLAHPGPLCLPEVTARATPLRFRLWRPGEALREGAFRVMVPAQGAVAVPDVLIVPLLAFDRRGYRLGYGGGFYDRTLAALHRPRAIGLAFAAQEVEEVPAGPTDLPLDLIVTEGEVISPA